MTGVSVSAQASRPGAVAQWLAVLVTVVVVAALAVALPRAASSSQPQDMTLVGGERFAAGGVSLVVADGWTKTAGTELLVVSKGDAKLLVLPPTSGPDTPAASVTASAKGYLADPSAKATAGAVATSTTDSGLSVATITVTQKDSVTELVAFSDGSTLSTGSVFVPTVSWDSLRPEIDSMIASVEFTKAATS